MKCKYMILYFFLIIANSLSGCGYDMMKVYNQENLIAEDVDTFDLENSSEYAGDNIYEADYKLDGYGLVWSYESEEDEEIEVPYTLNVISGKAKIVLITDDGEVTTLIENNNKSENIKESSLNIKLKKGLNRIKIVGYKAEMLISMKIDKGKFVTIGLEEMKNKR